MFTVAQQLQETGLEVIDIAGDEGFRARKLHTRDAVTQMAGVRSLAKAFLDEPDGLLQKLVGCAIELCGADSAGISLVREDGTDDCYYKWVATAGIYESFLNAMLPREPSACSVCLARGGSQRCRVFPKFFEILGVEAAPVSDGLLLPWRVDGTEGTIFIIAHDREEAFDSGDLQVMEMLADFAAMGMRQIRQRERLLQQANAEASAAMAHELAHEINNPLQSITNLLYLASNSPDCAGERQLAGKLKDNVLRLNAVARHLLELPRAKLNAMKSEVL